MDGRGPGKYYIKCGAQFLTFKHVRLVVLYYILQICRNDARPIDLGNKCNFDSSCDIASSKPIVFASNANQLV